MPWYKPILLPEYMKKKCYIYLIQRYVGQYLEEKLTAEQLTVDLYKGTGVLTNLRLDVQALNELAEKQNWPFQFVDGFIEELFVTVPWSSLLKESSSIEITSLRITMQPKQRNESATSMFESMWSSMTSSLHLAEECVKQGFGNSPNQTYEGLEVFAQTIDSILSRIRVKLKNSTFQFEHLPRNSPMGVGVVVNVESILYADESSNDPSKEEATDLSKQEEKKAYFEQSYTARSARLEGITISTVEFSSKAQTVASSGMSDSLTNIIEGSSLAGKEEVEEAKAEINKNQYTSNDERNIIKFGQFGGKIEVVVRLKRTEDLDGPKVSIEMDASPLLLFVSPRQVHLLFELAAGWTNPDVDDYSDVLNPVYTGKPMSTADYARIEKDLQHQLSNPIPTSTQLGFAGGHGWATGALDCSDIEENFTPMGKYSSAGIYETAMSGVSTMESSFSSSMASSYTDITNRTRKKINKIDTDPTAEISRFEIHLASLAVVLLNEDILTESSKSNGRLASSSVAEMQSIVETFFKQSNDVFLAGNFKAVNDALDNTCCLRNHLRLIASPVHIEGDEKTTSSAFSISGSLEATHLELSEFLFNNKAKGVEHVPLISFSDTKPVQFESPHTAKPSLKLIFKHLAKTSKNSKTGPKTDLLFELHTCVVELDITLMDRIAALLNPQQICVVPKVNKAWATDTTGNTSSSNDSKIDIRVSSPQMRVKLRFPIPDLRSSNDMTKPPWWHRCVRQDFLSILLSGMNFQTFLQTHQTVQNYTLTCRTLNVDYYENANADPEPIGKAGYEDKAMMSLQDAVTDCKLNIQIFPPKRFNPTEPSKSQQDPMTTSIMVGLLENHKPNGPFSSKRVIYESDTPHHKYQSELLVPGDKSEIDDFIKSTIESARVRVDITLPIVSLQLISKCLYEKLYNRINNDLFLWEPGAPKHKPTTPGYDTMNYRGFRNIDIDNEDVFTICKSKIQYDSESETDEETEDNATIFYSTYGSKMKFPHNQILSESKEESYLTLNLQIGRGLLYTCTPVRDATTNNVIPNQQGEFLINVEDATIFMVSGYMGDKDLSYTCLEFHKAQMHHCDMISTPSHSPPLKDIGAAPGKYLHPTIYGSESGMLANNKNRGGNREMVTLCVKIQASHETHNVKNVSVAAGFNKVTLRHRMCNEPNSWVSQLIDFFNVTDDPILGYTGKEILTELFLHFWDSSIDYRPRYLPLRSVITLGTFSISSHLSAEANTSTLRFIAEDCGLFLSQKGIRKNNLPYTGPIDLKRDYVNVIDLGIFEISLKTSDKKNLETPHFDLRASNDIIHIRTCADTAQALTQLIKYLASNGDLLVPDDGTSSTSSFSSPRHLPEQELVSVEPQEINNLSASQHQQINELIQDALEDVDDSSTAPASMELYAVDENNTFYFPGETDPSKDSGRPLPQVTTELGQVPPNQNIADSDEDFCFIDEEPGFDIFPKNGVPEIQWLTEDPVRVIENHFAVPSERSDPLKTPKNFPTPTKKYTLCEMSIVWHMYGGNDFGVTDREKKKTVNFADLKLKDSVSFSNTQKERVVIESQKVAKRCWLVRGGPNRDHNVLMELQLNKIRFQHEAYPESSSKASRQVLIITEIEMRDRLKSSNMNKFLYQYISQVRPKQSNANMLVIKTLHVKPDPQLRSQECCLKISALPLRFNIDQDALQFLITFFTELGTDAQDDDLPITSSKHNTPVHQPPVMTVNDENEQRVKEEAIKKVNENLMLFEQENKITENSSDEPSPATHSTSEESPIYFRKVIFSPDVPIRLDYHGKHFDLRTHGPLQGLLMGLAQLNCSELRLKRITYRHGLLGFEKLLMFLIREWVNDIKKNQIQNLLVGVGPMYSFVQLYQGIRDLFFLPFEQYKKDGRFFRGLHRGANSFTTSTAMAALELTTRLIHLIQITAETAFDMLTPGPSVKINPKTKVRRKRYNQPKDIREGVTNAYKLVKEGIEETADNILQVASHEHEQKGYSGAVGGVIRQIPPTIIKPIIIASEATNNVLGGMRCQLVPDARKEANEKWRSEDAYDSYE